MAFSAITGFHHSDTHFAIMTWTVTHRNWKQSWHLVQLQVFITPIRILRRICLHFGRLLADTFLVRSTYWVRFFGRCASSMLSWEEPCGFRPLLNWRKKIRNQNQDDRYHFKCIWHETFYWLIWKSVQSDGEWRLFYRGGILVCLVIQDFGLCKSDGWWRRIVDAQWCKITKFGISVQMLGVQGWNFAGLMCCKNYTC